MHEGSTLRSCEQHGLASSPTGTLNGETEALQDEKNESLLLPSERSMLHRALPITLFLLFPESQPKAAIQALGQPRLFTCVRLLRSQPVVAGWGACKAVCLLTLPASSPYLASLGEQPPTNSPHLKQKGPICNGMWKLLWAEISVRQKTAGRCIHAMLLPETSML